jgi:hypothetical protein
VGQRLGEVDVLYTGTKTLTAGGDFQHASSVLLTSFRE